MLEELEKLAEDIAVLRRRRESLGGSVDALLIGQIITHLEMTLDALGQRLATLVGTMPWWRHFVADAEGRRRTCD